MNKLDIEQAVKQSAESLIDEGFVEDYCHLDLLEKATQKWLENLIDELPDNIDWFYRNFSDFQKLCEKAELESAKLDLDRDYPDGIDLEELIG